MHCFLQKDLSVIKFCSIAGLATQFLIIDRKNKEHSLLVDIGDSTCRDIVSNKLDFAWINSILLTHGHYDHMGGVYTFLGMKRMLGHTKPIHIYYPGGSQEIIGILKTYNALYKDSSPFEVIEHSLPTESIQKNQSINSSFQVDAHPVRHLGSITKDGKIVPGPLIPAFGYKIRHKSGFTLSISGDSAPTDGLIHLFSKDIDLAFIESTHPTLDWVSDKVNRFHLTEDEAHIYTNHCRRTYLTHELPNLLFDK